VHEHLTGRVSPVSKNIKPNLEIEKDRLVDLNRRKHPTVCSPSL